MMFYLFALFHVFQIVSHGYRHPDSGIDLHTAVGRGLRYTTQQGPAEGSLLDVCQLRSSGKELNHYMFPMIILIVSQSAVFTLGALKLITLQP